MIYCTKCGSELPDEAKFCTVCGEQLSSNESGGSAENFQENISQAIPSDKPEKKKNTKRNIAIAAAVAAFIFVVGLIGGSGDDGKNNEITSLESGETVEEGEDTPLLITNERVKKDEKLPNGAYFDISKEDIVKEFEEQTGTSLQLYQMDESDDENQYFYSDNTSLLLAIITTNDKVTRIGCSVHVSMETESDELYIPFKSIVKISNDNINDAKTNEIIKESEDILISYKESNKEQTAENKIKYKNVEYNPMYDENLMSNYFFATPISD